MGIGSHETVKPITVYNVDGTENSQGKITHYCWLRIWYEGRQKLQRFYIVALGKESIILGYPFLYAFNPTINWQQGALPGDLHIQTPRYKYRFRDIFCYAPGLILCAMCLSVLIFCYIRLASRLCVPPDRLTAHTGHPRYLDT